MRLFIAMLLAATFFYYMSYNAMTTNISRYADIFYGMGGGSYAIINIVPSWVHRRVPAPLLPAVAAPNSVHKDEPDPRIRPIWGSFSVR